MFAAEAGAHSLTEASEPEREEKLNTMIKANSAPL